MSGFTISKVRVHPVERQESTMRGFARVEIEGGLFISELRIYEDSRDSTKLFIAFPTRQHPNGEDRKVAYPVTDEARKSSQKP